MGRLYLHKPLIHSVKEIDLITKVFWNWRWLDSRIEQQMWERVREQSHGLPCAKSRVRLTEQMQNCFGFRHLDMVNLAVHNSRYIFYIPSYHYLSIFSFKLHVSLWCSTFCISLTFFLLGPTGIPRGSQTGLLKDVAQILTCKPSHKKGPDSGNSSSQVSRWMWYTSPSKGDFIILYLGEELHLKVGCLELP